MNLRIPSDKRELWQEGRKIHALVDESRPSGEEGVREVFLLPDVPAEINNLAVEYGVCSAAGLVMAQLRYARGSGIGRAQRHSDDATVLR